MQTTPNAPELDWVGGDVPVSRQFDDPYYARSDGLAESRHVFLDGNALPRRLAEGSGPFHVAELGFGTGLNILALIALRDRVAPNRPLEVTSFEAWPMTPDDRARALAPWPELAPLALPLTSGDMPDWRSVAFTLVEGDARETLPRWSGAADAWFLDGFAPARNPEMWGAMLLAEVFRHTNTAGTFATYTAAGQVRRDLIAAGFSVEKSRGYGTKRDMLRGHRPGDL